MAEQLLPCVERVVGPAPRVSVIWLHGLGASANDFVPVVDMLQLDGGYRFVFPDAPLRSVTLNGGLVMPAWFDIVSLDAQGVDDEAGIAASAERINALIARELDAGVPPGAIVLVGFSQGAALALYVAARYPQRLGGVAALSGFLPCAGKLAQETPVTNADLPVFMAHGVEDPVVRLGYGEASRDALVQAGFRVAWHAYPMLHEVIPEELADLASWLNLRRPQS